MDNDKTKPASSGDGASNYKRMTGRVFTTRTIPREGVVRCWRVK